MSFTRPLPPRSAGSVEVPAAPLARFVRAAARAASRRPKLTIALWLVLILACAVLGSLSGTRVLSVSASGVGESARAQARLISSGLAGRATENVLVRSNSAQRTAQAVATLRRRAGGLPTVLSMQTPWHTPGLSRAGGRIALVVVTLRGAPADAASHVAPLERLVSSVARQSPGVSVQESGGGSIKRAMNQIVDRGLRRAELIALPITLLILVFAFGAVVAALVPLLLGVTSVGAALGALGLVSQVAPNGSSTAPVVVLIGLAVGVDYSLFYIRRERAERRAGASADAALDATASTVGRAILVAGMTVVIGLAGLLFTGFGVFTSMALGAILVVAIAVLGSLTVLPAVLAVLGERVDRGRLWGRRPAHRPQRPRTTLWSRFAETVTGHPRSALALAVIVLAGLALPILGMRTADPGARDASAKTPVLVAEHAVENAFPGSSEIGQLVVIGNGLGAVTARAGLAALGREGRTITGGRGDVSVRVSRTGETALVSIPVPSGNLAVATRDVQALRLRLKPATARLIPGAHAQLTGHDAENVDFTHRLSAMTPLVIAFVLALAFLLLVGTFRSPLLALSVMALNLLSVGAAFGVLVAVFQHTWAQALLGFTSDGAVVNWLPLFAFVVLFGLSMDYTVLVLERAGEARRAGAGAREAAAEALGSTGSAVTSAAIVMVAVFAVFATLPLLEFKQLGIGLAAAIALDATVVRALALPAVLTLLGDRGLRPAPARLRRAGLAGREPAWDHQKRVAFEATHE